MTVILGVICVVLVAGLTTVILLQRSYNKTLTRRLANLQAELTTTSSNLSSAMDRQAASIKAEVDQRLVDHSKYCDEVDAILKSALAEEEKKWRELLKRIKSQFADAIAETQKESVEKQGQVISDVEKSLSKYMEQFRALMEREYLDQYEKMKRSPPRPNKKPKTKIVVPERFRSLDDDFNCGLEPEPPPEPEVSAEPKKPATKKRATKKKK